MWIPDSHLAFVYEVIGNPIVQLDYLLNNIVGDPTRQTYVIERLHHFRNAKTTRSLLERYGYLFYGLAERGYQVQEASTEAARKFLKVIGKQEAFDYLLPFFEGKYLSNHHTDALTLALYQASLDGFVLDESRLTIVEGELR